MKMSDAPRLPLTPYFSHERQDIVRNITKGPHRVLDVGCGAGMLGDFLKKWGYASQVIGFELIPEVAADARKRLDHVVCCNLNNTRVEDGLSEFPGNFDYIVCADILEHLIDPWSVIADLATRLTPRGSLILSLPNVRHWTVSLPLVFRGKWEYSARGIMDRTHLRFFSRQAAVNLLTQTGLDLVSCHAQMGTRAQRIDKIFMGVFTDFLASQWVLVGIRGL